MRLCKAEGIERTWVIAIRKIASWQIPFEAEIPLTQNIPAFKQHLIYGESLYSRLFIFLGCFNNYINELMGFYFYFFSLAMCILIVVREQDEASYFFVIFFIVNMINCSFMTWNLSCFCNCCLGFFNGAMFLDYVYFGNVTLIFFMCYNFFLKKFCWPVQVAIVKESFTSILFTFCIEETCIFWGNSGEAGAGVCQMTLVYFLCVFLLHNWTL